MHSTDSFVITIMPFKYCLGNYGLQGSLQTSQPWSVDSDWPMCSRAASSGCQCTYWKCAVLFFSGVMITKGFWVLETTFIGAEGSLCILFQPRLEGPHWRWHRSMPSRAPFLSLSVSLPFLGPFLCTLWYLSKSHVTEEVPPFSPAGCQQNQKPQTGDF